jgi:hypothetical protein
MVVADVTILERRYADCTVAPPKIADLGSWLTITL